MVRYMKCPRCELNYIDAEKQTYCDVCQKEMKGISLDIDELEDVEDFATELCPVCNENMMRAGEKMCEECRKKAEFDEEGETDPEEDDEWREYLDDDTDDLDDELGESLKEEFSDAELEEEEEEEEIYENEEEDLEYVTGDEIYMISDDEEDDDENEDDDF